MIKTKPLPPLEYLQECFKLDTKSPSYLTLLLRPKTHFKSRRAFNSHLQFAGKPAGTISIKSKAGDKYFVISLDGKKLLAHRIVFSLQHKELVGVEVEIDHKDGNGLNNKPTNLRKANHSQNQRNSKLSRNNPTGEKCVFLRKYNNTYYGRISVNGKAYKTSFSKSKEKIVAEIKLLREKLHGEFANHGDQK